MVKGPAKRRFEEVFSTGKRTAGSLARLASTPGIGLVGIATSKKIGSVPDRNRLKRQFREAIRIQPDIRKQTLDYVLIVHASATQATFERIQQEVRELFAEAERRWESESESS